MVALLVIEITAHAQSYSIDWYKVSGGGGTSTNGQYFVTGGFWSLYAVQTPGAPLLTITYSGNKAIVSWPSPATGFTLQTNRNLATGTWVNYGGIVGDDGTIKTMTNSPTAGTLFFRLAHP